MDLLVEMLFFSYPTQCGSSLGDCYEGGHGHSPVPFLQFSVSKPIYLCPAQIYMLK